MKKLAVLILAAGIGKRLKSRKAKVLHTIAGEPMIMHVLKKAIALTPLKIIIIIGHQSEAVKACIKESSQAIKFVEQKGLLGTAHAVLQAEKSLHDFDGTVLILSGDVPLIGDENLRFLYESHRKAGNDLTIVSTVLTDPSGYGRVLRDANGGVIRIIEDRDATEEEKKIREINTGIYAAEKEFLFTAVKGVKRENTQQEYYLTDIIEIAVREGRNIGAITVKNAIEVMGINTRVELADAERYFRERKLSDLMLNGVTIVDPANTYIGPSVSIGIDSIICPNTFLEGMTTIGEDCVIYPNVRIIDSHLGNRVVVKECCFILEGEIEDEAIIGPFAHLRPETVIKRGAKIGNFVEVKKSTVGEGSKALHLSYIGDTTIGKGVNIGAGTITCNYDGTKKYPTIIEDEVFVGSDTQFVAPVRVGRGAVIAAGSTITKDVPRDALAISRVEQKNKEDWVRKKKLRVKSSELKVKNKKDKKK
ncbi:MAG: bifunctional UDP-N-acetylglucosamine diphosphorylase/glucosamine-1-phosphate N-acetyltransferase GlmU [Nitrospirota bacterium]